MADRVSLRNMVFYAYHGVHAGERETGRRFEVDVDLYADLRPAGESDALERTANYGQIYRIVKAVVESGPYNLLEAIAEKIAAQLRGTFAAQRVTVRVRKVHPPVGGPVDYAEVEITRPA
ncbi:MAG TPA: dihydroneopterin aldolase [Limnochordales bacterium]